MVCSLYRNTAANGDWSPRLPHGMGVRGEAFFGEAGEARDQIFFFQFDPGIPRPKKPKKQKTPPGGSPAPVFLTPARKFWPRNPQNPQKRPFFGHFGGGSKAPPFRTARTLWRFLGVFLTPKPPFWGGQTPFLGVWRPQNPLFCTFLGGAPPARRRRPGTPLFGGPGPFLTQKGSKMDPPKMGPKIDFFDTPKRGSKSVGRPQNMHFFDPQKGSKMVKF
jgi:hypothetical protein